MSTSASSDGVAALTKKDFESAEREQEAFRAAKESVPETPVTDSDETGKEYLEVSDLFIAGELALQKERQHSFAVLVLVLALAHHGRWATRGEH